MKKLSSKTCRSILSFLLLFFTILYYSTGVASEDILQFLPAFIGHSNTGGIVIPPNPVRDPTPEDLENYYNNFPLGSHPGWIIGQWTTSAEYSDERATLNADGTCLWEWTNYSTHSQGSFTGKWGIKNNNQFYLLTTDTNDLKLKLRVGVIGTVSNTSFHISGFNSVKGYQYNKLEAGSTVAKYPGQYFLGTWHTYLVQNGYKNVIWDFSADGNLLLSIYDGNTFLTSHAGSWSVTSSILSLNVPGTIFTGDHSITGPSYGSFNTTSSIGPFTRRVTPYPQTDIDSYVGQYHGFDTTMYVSSNGEGYQIHLVDDGLIYNYNAIVQGRNLVITAGNKIIKYTKQLGGYERADNEVSIIPDFPDFLYKISPIPLDDPTSVVGRWEHIGRSGKSSTLLMPGGHYEISFGNTVMQEGQYTITNNTLNLSPTCSVTRTESLDITENQWVMDVGNNLTTTYIYEPFSNISSGIYEKGFVMARTINNNLWKKKIQLGGIRSFNPSRTVAVGNAGIVTVGQDLFPNDVYSGATVFKKTEPFWWHDYLVNNLDDSVFYFYPNGRFLYVSVNYDLIPETYYDIVPRYAGNVLYLWGKYKIDDTIESNPRSAFDKKQITLFSGKKITLFSGHRVLHFPDTNLCWDSLTWLNN